MLRCEWANSSDDYVAYHDGEWGKPIRNDRALFERLSLESFQSGLSWITVLRKREAFREVFMGFDPLLVAEFDEPDIKRLLADARIIRHRGKIESCINNARVLRDKWEQVGDGWLTAILTEYAPSEASLAAQGFIRPPTELAQLPASTVETVALAKALKAEGMRFLGPTTLYAGLQATGFVHDHVLSCHLFDKSGF
jgi:DNA-3-methyladenine glycosylase I